jgi:hypothetical protein
VLCVTCARRCGWGDECAVRSGWCCVGRPAGVRDLSVLGLSVLCALSGVLACAVLGDTRHDADVPLWWVGLVVSSRCVSGVCVV